MVKYINFIVSDMTALRYFVPLVIEGNERGFKSRFFIVPVPAKHNCSSKHRNQLNSVLKEYNIEEFNINKINDHPDPTFIVEGVGLNYIDASKGHKIFSISYMTDFNLLYDKYVNKVDGIIFPSEPVAQHYAKNGPKNLYLGSPKYDAKLDEEDILKKYDIPDLNNILVVLPKIRDLNATHSGFTGNQLLIKSAMAAKSSGLRTLYKARRKDRIQLPPNWGELCTYMYFEDEFWYPHTTMELMKVSRLVINFSSTTIKECTMLGVPVVNFDIKPLVRHGKNFGEHRVGFSFLYESDFCRQLKPDISAEELAAVIEEMISTDWTASFSKTRKKYLFEGNSSKRILDHLGVK